MDAHILALETSSAHCEVAVLSLIDSRVRVFAHTSEHAGRHAEQLLPLVDTVLSQAQISRHDLSAIAFGQGPGGFTGLRVACGTAQGMAFGLERPVIPIPSLLAIAQRARSNNSEAVDAAGACYLCVQDARMGEVYLALYKDCRPDNPSWQALQAPILLDAQEVANWLALAPGHWPHTVQMPWYLCGDAAYAYPELAQLCWQGSPLPTAEARHADAPAIAYLALEAWQRGAVVPPEEAAPLYVRDKVAFTKQERAQGKGGNPRAHRLEVHLHAMQETHLDAVASIESRIQSFPWTRRNFADGLKAGYPAWVLCREHQVIGFYMALVAPDLVHLLVIGVDPDYQGQGWGRLLIEHCEAQAYANDLQTIVLEVRESNLAAIGFYKHLGFRPFSVRKDYYPAHHGRREPAHVMRKDLARSSRDP